MNDLKYEKEGAVSRFFSKFKKNEVYDEELPELSRSILNSASKKPELVEIKKPVAPSTLDELPKVSVSQSSQTSGAIQNLSKIAEEIKKVDISKMSELPKLKVERVDYPPLNFEKELKEIEAIKKTEKKEKIEETIAANVEAIKNEFRPETYNSSFFSTLANHIEKESELLTERKYLKSELLTKNLVAEMKQDWEKRKEDIRTTTKDKNTQTKILDKISELKKLETEWQTKELAIEELKKQLEFIESMIEEKSMEFKGLLRELKFTQNAQMPFILSNGRAIRNIADLLSMLKMMDTLSFNEHVNEMKNDFSVWILKEFKDELLAKRVKDAYSKEDLIAILETY